MAFDPTDAVPVADAATPGFAFDTTDAKPVREVGAVEGALRIAAQTSQKVVRTFDMAAAGLAGLFGDTEGQDKIFADAQLRQQRMNEAYAPKEDERFGMGAKVAGAGLSIPAAMLAPGAAAGVDRAVDVIDRGGSLSEARKAGAVAGGVDIAMQAVPAAAGLKVAARAGAAGKGAARSVATGAATGAAINVPAGIAGRVANTAALPEGEQFKDLREDALDPEALAMDAVMSLGFGAMGGKAGHAKGKAAAKAKADAAPPPFPADKMKDVGDGKFTAPNGAPVTKEDWEAASPRVRDGWMKEKPVEEKVPAGETSEISVDEAVAKAKNAGDTAELDRVIAADPDSPIAKMALEERGARLKAAAAEEKKAADKATATEYRRTAEGIKDEGLKKRVLKAADELDPPTKEKPLPTGEVREGQPEIKVDEPKKPLPTGKAKEVPLDEAVPPAEQPKAGEIPAGEVVPEGGTRLTRDEADALLAEGKPIPAGEATPVGRPAESTASTSLKGLDVTEQELLPVGEAREGQPDIPVSTEKIPAGEAFEDVPTGEAVELKKIPVGKVIEGERNATGKIPEQEGVQQERVQGDEGRQAPEAGAGDRVQRAAEGGRQVQAPGKAVADAYVRDQLEGIKRHYKLKDLPGLNAKLDDHQSPARDDMRVLQKDVAEIKRLAAEHPQEFAAAVERNDTLGDGTPMGPVALRRQMSLATDKPESTFAVKPPTEFEKLSPEVIERERAKAVKRTEEPTPFPTIDESLLNEQNRPRLRGDEQRTAAAPALERGRRQARAELERARDAGEIDKDGADLALWALDKNPHLASGLRVESRGAQPDRPNTRGSYMIADQVVKLFDTDKTTAAHEILHHSERMMPLKVQEGIRRAWRQHLQAEIRKTKDPEKRAALAAIPRAIAGDKPSLQRVRDAVTAGKLDYSHYNPSEFWAEHASRILSERFAGRNSWRAEAVQWLREMIEHVKGTVGIRSDSPVLKALNQMLDQAQNPGKRRSDQMLLEGGDFSDLEHLAPAKGKPTLPEETPGERKKRLLFDSQRPTERAQEVTGITDEDADMRLAARLNLGNIQKRTEDFETKVKKPLEKALADAKEAGISVRDADDYLIALHAPERNAVIKGRDPKNDAGSGYTDQQAKDIIDSFTPEQKKHLDKIAGMVHKLNRDKLDAMVDDGLVTPETRDSLNAQFKKYVPLKTLEEEANFTGAGRGYQTWANDIVSATGRTSRAGSPIAASIMDATRGITRGERAKVNKVIWNFANHADSGDIVKAYDSANPPPEVLKAELDSKGQKHMVVDQGKLVDHTIPLVVDGHQQRVFVKDPALKEALATAGTPQQMGDIMRGISKATRAFTRTLTEWNIAFAPVNMVRDAGTAVIRAKRLGIDSTAFMPQKIARAQAAVVAHLAGKRTGDAAVYEEMLNAGGKTGGYGLTSLADTMADLERMGADLGYDDQKGGVGRRIGRVARVVGEGLSKYNEVFEYGTRLAAYKAAREKGMTPKRAAEVARKITVDFNVSGDVGRRMGHVYAFANAALQGLHGDVKDLKSPKTRYRMLSLVGLGAATQIYNEVFGGENEETGDKNIDSQGDSSLDSSVTLLNPGTRGGVKVPLPPGVATGLYTLGRRLARLTTEGNVEREATGILSAAVQSVIPVRFAEGASQVTNVLQGLTPALVRPGADIAVNSNQFGMPIVPQSRDTKSPPPAYTLSRQNTSDIAKGTSKFLNDITGGDEVRPGLSQKYLGNFVAPEAIEYLTGYYTGGVGQLALQSKNIVKNATEGKPQDINKIPVVRRFAFKEPQSYTSRRFHELQQEYEYAKDYDKAEKPEKISPAVQATLDDYKAADKELSALFKDLREASTDADREPIQAQIKAVQSAVIKAYNRARNEQ